MWARYVIAFLLLQRCVGQDDDDMHCRDANQTIVDCKPYGLMGSLVLDKPPEDAYDEVYETYEGLEKVKRKYVDAHKCADDEFLYIKAVLNVWQQKPYDAEIIRRVQSHAVKNSKQVAQDCMPVWL